MLCRWKPGILGNKVEISKSLVLVWIAMSFSTVSKVSVFKRYIQTMILILRSVSLKHPHLRSERLTY